MKKIICILSIFLVYVSAYSQTKKGYVTYEELGNTISIGRQVLQRTDRANIDTLTSVFTGSLAYDTINEVVVVYNGLAWEDVGSGGGGGFWSKTDGRVYPSNLTDTVNVGSSTKNDAKFNVDGTAEMKSGADRALFVGEYNTKLDAADLRINGAGYEYIVGDTVMQSIAGSLEINQGGGYLPLANTLTSQIWIDGADNINRMSLSPTNGSQLYAGSLFTTSPSASLELNPVMGQGYTASVSGSKRNFRWADLTNVIDPIYYTLSDAGLKLTSKEFYVKNATTGNNIINCVYDNGIGGSLLVIESDEMEINTLSSALTMVSAKNAFLTASRTLTLKSTSDAINLQSLTGINFEGAYTFPLADGYVGTTLKTDGVGGIKWGRNVKSAYTIDETVTNTQNDTEIFSHIISADGLRVGSVITIELAGQFSNASASDDFGIRFYINSVNVHDLLRVGGNVTATGWSAKYMATIRSIGSSGTLSDYAEFVENGEAVISIADIGTHTVNTTATIEFAVSIKWANSDVGNTFTQTQGILRVD